MKRQLLAGVAAAVLLSGGHVLAQSVTVELSPTQRTTIKEYVVKEKIKPITVRERMTVGATLPADVELHAVPSGWGPSVAKYRYVYSDNRVYFVEPSNRRVIYSVD